MVFRILRILLKFVILIGFIYLIYKLMLPGSYTLSQWKLEIFGGLITSFVFLGIMLLLRPLIFISPHICNENGIYRVKVVNYGLTTAIDLKFQFSILKIEPAPKGENVVIKYLDVNFPSLEYLPSKFSKYGWRNDLHAIQITIKEDLDNTWIASNNHCQLVVSACHGISGFKKVFKEKYNHKKSVIKQGSFVCGYSLKVT